ncbi:hypothetical protein MNBD_GAMMA12-3793 [hydrothermal vent metagenome]|uniref:Insecticidal toxin complex protein n=1 Tax=hydrothermal vent metagenome TaxID=652676 RepID=A0A3B0YKK6_9ZZZZ
MNNSINNPGTNAQQNSQNDSSSQSTADKSNNIQVPEISLPTGGGAIRGIEEKFQVNAITGTSSFSIPVPLSPSRHGFMPAVGLSYNSGSGNSPFGLGWNMGIPSIARKTDKQLPHYRDEQESDTFIISGSEDLVPLLEKQGDQWVRHSQQKTEEGIAYTVTRYRPRIEGSFARIEKWKNNADGDAHWRTISGDNIHSYYGQTSESRVSDPHDASRVFEWLLCRTHDDKGNIIVNQYKQEDFADIASHLHEKNRVNNCTQTYIKNIYYGNKTPYYQGDAIPDDDDFLFRTVFDYGEHDAATDSPKDIDLEKDSWDYRDDAFSSYRPGFEIRTYRRCKRIMMFHCFDAPDLPHTPYLVKSLELHYEHDLPLTGKDKKIEGFSFLVKATQKGFKWDNALNHYISKSLPDLTFDYQQHQWNTNVEQVSTDSTVNAPMGIDDKRYLWVDLFSEGISGILTEQAGAWFYKSNLGNGEFSNANQIASKPSFNGLSSGAVSIHELEGDGIKCLVQQAGAAKGFFKLSPDEEWGPFKEFESIPNIDMRDPNIRGIDLSGDGLADLLVTEENTMRWYPGAGEKGFKVSQTVNKAIDEEKGPAILFEDRSQSIFLADMSGDGLTDIVRIKNGEICYWPNLGYGHFGAKVNMDDAPLFDYVGKFNPAYLRLADIDGSGTIDIVYLGQNNFKVWMNLNGNAWTQQAQVIEAFPHINQFSDVSIIDFLGSGTACIVYSSPLPQDMQQPIQYIDLMGSIKPALLNAYQNNTGTEVSIEYKSSTHFYLEDQKEGRPWITKLPFPVHCISKTTIEDKIRETIFTSSYRYSHGYYDSHEREYRGFARVEQLDTEIFSQFKLNEAKNVVDEEFHQPPVKSISWFHTGAYIANKKILHQLENEYFSDPAFTEYEMPEPGFDDDLPLDELIEAYRACKGISLRTETYAEDDTDISHIPYSASQTTVDIRRVQAKNENRFASFQVIPSESISYEYERNTSDPRIQQSYVLKIDELGNVVQSASVVYPRVSRPLAPNDIPDKVWAEQNKLHITYSDKLQTNDISTDEVYRLRVGIEAKSFEIRGISQPVSFYLSKATLISDITNASKILFDEDFNVGLESRLTSHSRSYFLKDDLSGPLPLGQVSALAIGHKSYQLAFTKNLVSKHYGTKVTDAMLIDAKYEHSEGDDHWWAPSGTVLYAADPKENFYTPVGGADIFGNKSFIEYDQNMLLSKKTTDAIGNFSTARNDYRTLSPDLLTDINLNRAAVETDELGMVIKSAVMGKEGAGDGDTLADPTARMEYDLLNWQNNRKPNFVHAFAREQHGAANPRWQEAYTYSDGGGSVIMIKAQAEPGKATKWDELTQQVIEVDADPRWIGNGRTIINNKGNPVKQYEPYFSNTHEYESEDSLVETGISSITYYDPIGRNIRTEHPNGTFSKIEFDSWYSKSFDVNDTIKDSQWYIDRGSPDPDIDPEPADVEQRAAWLAAKHYNTPAVAHTDSLGRSFYAVADYGNGKTTRVYSETDLAGRYLKVFDQLGRLVSQGNVNLLGQAIYGKSAEKGEQWTFTDVMGRLVKAWDNNDREFRSTFDKLHRPISTFVKIDSGETLFGHTVYGDIFPDLEATQRNLKGQVYQVYDQAGVVSLTNIDYRGNVTSVERQLTKEYKQLINWQALEGINSAPLIESTAVPFLGNEKFKSSTTMDALNRPILVTLPDQSIIEPKYNNANILDSLRVKIRGQGDFIPFLENQDYDAKGQREFAQYANGLITNYFYDPKMFNLVNLVTKKSGSQDAQSIQNLHYTSDPVGNIVFCKDDAQQTHFFDNTVVKPESHFEYDALYQLIKASGREHAGLGGNTQRSNSDLPILPQLPHANDLSAVREYSELFQYDDCGNILQMQHVATNANWILRYRYQYQDDPTNNTNQLKTTSLPGDADDGPYSAAYEHDIRGNMTKMPHLNELIWNFMDQLTQVDLGGGGKAYYVFGIGGTRIRKVIERLGGKKTERIYLGAVEIYREYQNSTLKLERSTLHVSDNTARIAQVDTKIVDVDDSDTVNPLDVNLIRYQYSNHLSSASIETDEKGVVISYEEYHAYGTSAYRSSKSNVDFSLKRYRFIGKELDDETGLYYVGARFYAAWLGRWTSSDPAGFVDGLNTYQYVTNNPINYIDKNGLEKLKSDNALNENATFEELRDYGGVPSGYEFDQSITEENYRAHWVADGGYWRIWVPTGTSNAANVAPAVTTAVQKGARPQAAAVPDQQARARVGQPRSFAPGEPLQGPYNLWSNEPGGGLADAAGRPGFIMEDTVFEEAAEAMARSKGYTGRYDPRLKHGSPHFNAVWHSTSDALATRVGLSQMPVTSNGLESWRTPPHGAPHLTVQMAREIPRIQLSGGLMAIGSKLSGIVTIASASQIDNPYVRWGGIAAGSTEFVGGSAYLLGAADLGGGYFGATGATRLMGFGGAAARVGGGAGMIILSGYSGVVNFQNGNYGVVPGDAAGVVGGVGVLASSGPTVVVSGTFMAGNYAGDWAERQVTPNHGRGWGVAAGTGAGLGVGAAVGGGLVAFGLVSNPVGWGILAVGGVAGLIGAIW